MTDPSLQRRSDGITDEIADALVVFLYVDDLERSAAFYGEALGLPLVLDQGSCRLYRVAPGGFVGVCGSGDRPTTSNGLIVTLVRDDVDAYCAQLVSRGVELEQPPTHNERFGIHHAFLRDPDGHLIEVQRFDDTAWSEPIADPGSTGAPERFPES